MIDIKEAVQIALAQAFEMLDQRGTNVEEIETDVYRDREIWDTTLGFPRDLSHVSPMARPATDVMQYKRKCSKAVRRGLTRP